MNGEKNKEMSIENQIKEWQKRPYNIWKEHDIIRLLTELEQSDLNKKEDKGKIKGQLLAMAAVARYYRKQELDEKIKQRMESAWEEAPTDVKVSEFVLHLTSSSFNERLYDENFPKIRETDHSQGKKKTIERLRTMLTEGEEKVVNWLLTIKQYQQAARNLHDQQAVEHSQVGRKLLQQLDEQLTGAKDAGREYEVSIKGIYSSKEKHNLLKEYLEELQRLNVEWQDWYSKGSMETAKDPLKKFQSMVGLEEVKEKIHQYYHYLFYQKERTKEGYHLKTKQTLNMILTGNPGTGKTALARLLAEIYHELGVLPREEVVEVNRSHLVGAYVGQTEEKTMEVIKEAIGGVLFIDEAYSLKREDSGGNDYGQAAIDTIVAAMTGEYAGQFAVILAGYPEEMRHFLWSNPGLRSRFPESNHIHLEDYSVDELVEIGENVALDNDYTLTSGAIHELKERIAQEKVDASFGNARTVTNIVMDAIFKKGAEVAQTKDFSKENFTILDKRSFQKNSDKTGKESKSGENLLQELVGLEDVKEQVNMLTSFVRVQQIRKDEGLPVIPVQLHSIFTGPPGTGKTTVAKIFGKILNELGLLKRGHLVIAGRSDLVAGYVGQTAIKTKRKIKEALGGVLFIDEAYSLFAKGEQDFGKEAIDTIVEEMTKHNENLVIILAGYSEPIEVLLNSNPGLASRFKKTISFPNYSSDELVEILLYYVSNYGYEVKEEAVIKLRETLVKVHPNGNGRAMKDLVEDAIQRQAYRLIREEKKEIAPSLTKLEIEDFSILAKGE